MNSYELQAHLDVSQDHDFSARLFILLRNLSQENCTEP